MRTAIAAAFTACFALGPALAQRSAPVTSIANLLPSEDMDEYAVTADAKRVYYSTLKGEVRMYDRQRNTWTHIADGGSIWDVTVAPNGSAVAFTMSGENDKGPFVWTVPLDPRTGFASGPQRRVSMISGDVPSFSPDGKLLAFARDDSALAQTLLVVPATGGPERALASFPFGIYAIRWSPSSRTLYFATNPSRRDRLSNGTLQRIPVSGGTAVRIAETSAGRPGLSPDGRTIAFRDTGFTHAYVIGDTNGKRLATFMPPSGTAIEYWLDDKTLLAERNRNPFRLRTYSIADAHSRILMDTVDRIWSPSWSRDGKRVAFGASIGQHYSLATMDASGGSARVFPLEQSNAGGSLWSPDGRWLLYHNTGQSTAVVAVEVATGKEVDLMKSTGNIPALWAPDSRHVILGTVATAPGSSTRTFVVHEVDLAGVARTLREVTISSDRAFFAPISPTTALAVRGTDQPITLESISGEGTPVTVLPAPHSFVSGPAVSPDGKWVAVRRNTQSMDNTKMSIVEIAALDGSSRKTITLPFYAAPGQSLQFLPGAKQLIITENTQRKNQKNEYGVYLVTIATGEARKLLTIRQLSQQGQFPNLALSPDGKTILYINRDSVPASYASVDVSHLLPSKP